MVATTGDASAPAGREEQVPGAGGVGLHVEHFAPTRPPRLVALLMHGYSSHMGLYRHMGAGLAAAGVATTLFDCRGHGRSTGRRGHVRRFSDFVDDLDLVVARARALHPTLPWALVGHSHGALVELEAVLSGRLRPDKLALAAPYLALRMKVPGWKLALAPIMSRLWPTLALPNGIKAEDVAREPQAALHFAADPLIHHVATSRWFLEARAAQERVLAGAGTLTTPTLLMLPGDDRLVDTQVSEAFAQAAGATVTVRRYPGVFHELFLEPEWPQVLADLTRWLCADPRPDADPGPAGDEDPAILQTPP
jgi:alpha-beta hydrolase superfamily lysophospholipase